VVVVVGASVLVGTETVVLVAGLEVVITWVVVVVALPPSDPQPDSANAMATNPERNAVPDLMPR
jgi:hypothetical protein